MEATVNKDGSTLTRLHVADASGSIVLCLWDELPQLIEPGDILQLASGLVDSTSVSGVWLCF